MAVRAQPPASNEVPAPTGTPTQPSFTASAPSLDSAAPGRSPTAPEPARLDDPRRLEIAFAPYIWITSFSGTQTVRGASFDVNQTFIDILQESNMVFGLMGAVDVRYDRLVFQFNAAWTTAEFETRKTALGSVDVKSDATLDNVWLELFGGYRVVDEPMGETPEDTRRITLDAFGGVRWTLLSLDADIKANGNATLPDGSEISVGQSVSKDESESWAEPFFGLRLGVDITDRWVLQLRGDVGGFGLGSDFSWQAAGVVGYRFELFGLQSAVFGGFRALGQDYTNGDFGWDMIVYGPMMGMQIAF